MHDSATVAAADIARLAGVGRAAVSNWRRRFEDFPSPVGGTSSSPLFSLTDVEAWLRRQGKLTKVQEEERVWQQIKASVDDLHLGHVLGHVGAFLLFLERSSGTWKQIAKSPDRELTDRLTDELASLELPGEPESLLEAQLLRTIAELALERNTAHVFDFMYERYLEAHSRRVGTVSRQIAELLVTLADADAGIFFDPSCGLGSMLMTAAGNGADQLFGQEREEHSARIAAVRLHLHGHRGAVRSGDAIRDDKFGAIQADAVACIPPFGERNWGYEKLSSDVRWLYGLPPRGEPELPWVQHGLYHLKPGRHMTVVMPPSASDRRSGRRIRAQLLRTGTLRAVVALPPGTAPGSLASPHLWILRRPSPGDPIPSHVLMLDLSDLPEDQVRDVALERWRTFSQSPGEGSECVVPVIDLLDEDVDLTPARHVGSPTPENTKQGFSTLLDEVTDSVGDLQHAVRNLRKLKSAHVELPKTTIAEQVRAGALTILQAPKTEAVPGNFPVLTVNDVLDGSGPSGRTRLTTDTVALEPGDVVVPSGGRALVARVIEEGGAVLGPGLYLFRVDPERIDPSCLAGFLRVSGASSPVRGQTGTSRADIRRAEIPRLPLLEQQRLGEAFRHLELFERAVDRSLGQASLLIQLGLAELTTGSIGGSD
ncbi:N-6 DNA methylase [Nonomuraea sp. NPDC049158]|uniref:N-6 DNA methylase n=1 Tax=Nonomuraea sp. NPDC049158 TaxID=3155649 RepID=UPI0033D43931